MVGSCPYPLAKFAFARCKFHGEVATTITETRTTHAAAPPPPVCISDPRRSMRQLYLRLETWLSRFWWEAFREGQAFVASNATGGDGHKLIESWLIGTELHYIRHLRRNRRPCEQCQKWIAERLRGERGRA